MISDVRSDTALVEHLMDLVGLTARCVEKNVVVGSLMRVEVTYLEDKLMSFNDSNDAVHLERFTRYVRCLLAYYEALLCSKNGMQMTPRTVLRHSCCVSNSEGRGVNYYQLGSVDIDPMSRATKKDGNGKAT